MRFFFVFFRFAVFPPLVLTNPVRVVYGVTGDSFSLSFPPVSARCRGFLLVVSSCDSDEGNLILAAIPDPPQCADGSPDRVGAAGVGVGRDDRASMPLDHGLHFRRVTDYGDYGGGSHFNPQMQKVM